MKKFFWGAIATVLITFAVHTALVPNIQANDIISNPPMSSTDNSDSNVRGNSELLLKGEGTTDTETKTITQPSEGVPSDGGQTKISSVGERQVGTVVPRVEKQVSTVIKQTEEQHIKIGQGSMYAIDITTSTGDVYFPDAYNEYVIYFIGEDKRLGNYIIIRHGNERWLFGHTVTSRNAGAYVRTQPSDNVLGQYNRSGISTGPHVHIERWNCPEKDSKMRECTNISSGGVVAPRNAELIIQRGWDSKEKAKSTKGNGPSNSTEVLLGQDKKVIACLNENNFTIHPAQNSGGTGCFLGKGGKWKNIMLPSQKDIDVFKSTFGDDYKYRLAIANFEGGFDENAGNPSAKGYLQTLRSYNIPKDIVSQLNWLKKREAGNTGPACEKYLDENFTLFGTMNIEKGKLAKYTCMGRRHYGAFSPGDPKTEKHWKHSVMYAKRYRIVTEYYLSLNF